MSNESLNPILPLLKEGTNIKIKEWDGLPEMMGYVIEVFSDGVGVMSMEEDRSEEFYFEIYEDEIEQLVEILN